MTATPAWHLNEAERLLMRANEADVDPDQKVYEKFTYHERAQVHINLAKELRKVGVPYYGTGPAS